MNPQKKIHTLNSQASSQNGNVEKSNDDRSTVSSEENSGSTGKKPRKRRTLSETSKRDFICGCGKSYVSYPAIYLHVQRKHNGEWPDGTHIPEKQESQDKVKRGRPKKEKNNMLDVSNDPESEMKYRVEDNFWLFMGAQGNSDNPKIENHFISNLESQPYDPMKALVPENIFKEDDVYKQVYALMLQRRPRSIVKDNGDQQQGEEKKEDAQESPKENVKPLYIDQRIARYVLWISNPLKEQIFIEMAIVVLFYRIILLSCVWFEANKDKFKIESNKMTFTFKDKEYSIDLKLNEQLNINAFYENNVCPLMGTKLSEVKKLFDKQFFTVMTESLKSEKSPEQIELSINEKVWQLSNMENPMLNKIVEAALYLKETELKDNIKNSKSLHFLSWGNTEALKELFQKMSDWFKIFNYNELKLKKILEDQYKAEMPEQEEEQD